MMMTNHPPTVDFAVSMESVQTVVMLLISNKIPFTLTSSNHIENTQKTIDSTFEMPDDPKDMYTPMQSKASVIESIYLKYLNQNIEQFPPKDAEIAAEFDITLGSFKNGFKAAYGKTFHQLYMEKKMEYAKMLLLKGFRAAEISERLGYSQHIKFSKIFQKYVGLTPTSYQRNHKKRIRSKE
jgi:AraC-like DNA-binding protein